MSETTEKKTINRFYIHEDGELYQHRAGQAHRLSLPVSKLGRVAQEATAMLMSKGWTFDQIISGEAFPDRTPPKAKAVSQPRVALSDEQKAARKEARKVDAKAKAAAHKALVAKLLAEHEAKHSAPAPSVNGLNSALAAD